jgi:hypothetical protein
MTASGNVVLARLAASEKQARSDAALLGPGIGAIARLRRAGAEAAGDWSQAAQADTLLWHLRLPRIFS